ncbi:hypothetical protein B0H19DRAFT_241430 [Mycena capillaripes]|nr:hypothetical protein B0H19DRAFT_241430 [Mycena capillaripes]
MFTLTSQILARTFPTVSYLPHCPISSTPLPSILFSFILPLRNTDADPLNHQILIAATDLDDLTTGFSGLQLKQKRRQKNLHQQSEAIVARRVTLVSVRAYSFLYTIPIVHPLQPRFSLAKPRLMHTSRSVLHCRHGRTPTSSSLSGRRTPRRGGVALALIQADWWSSGRHIPIPKTRPGEVRTTHLWNFFLNAYTRRKVRCEVLDGPRILE